MTKSEILERLQSVLENFELIEVELDTLPTETVCCDFKVRLSRLKRRLQFIADLEKQGE